MRIASALLIALLGLCLVACQPDGQEIESTTPPNIILIFTDELEMDDLSCYGGDIPTPHIDSLAAAGMRFSRAYAPASMCTPSRYSLLTGNYPGRCQYPGFLAKHPLDQPYSIAWNTFLTADTRTLPRALKAKGYHTAQVGKWHLASLPEGVEEPDFADDAKLEDPAIMKQVEALYGEYQAQVKASGGFDEVHSLIWENPDVHPLKALRYHNMPWMAHGALAYLDSRVGKADPFFMYIAPTAIHGPNHVAGLDADLRYTPAGFVSEVPQYQLDSDSIRRAMEGRAVGARHRLAGITQVDHLVGQIGHQLRQLDLADNTLIIFMADHNIEPAKATCFEKGIHVPLIVAGPGVQAGQTSEALVSNPDIFATLCEVAGQAEGARDGRSLWPVLQGTQSEGRSHVYAEAGYARSINDGRYKLITFRLPKEAQDKLDQASAPYAPTYLNVFKQAHSMIAVQHYPHYFDADQLYDLEADPYEQHNLAAEPALAEVKAALYQLLAETLADFDHPYALADTAFFARPDYPDMVARTRAIGTDFIPWLKGDHGGIVWPPQP